MNNILINQKFKVHGLVIITSTGVFDIDINTKLALDRRNTCRADANFVEDI